MTFVEMVFGKRPEDVRLSDIQALIENRVEEGHHLEYKGGKKLGEPEDLSRWISAFLNAEGGLIVVGVSEDDASKKERLDAKVYPQAIEYPPHGFTRERVEQIVHANIRGDDRPHIAVFPVRGEGNDCVYLLDVPQGQAPPYQAADGKYYRRLNFTKYAMAHYEIADFLGRRRRPCLHLRVQVVKAETREGTWRLTVRLVVSNDRRAAAHHMVFTVSFENAKIMAIPHGSASSIHHLRGLPSLQCWSNLGVVHPRPNYLYHLADIQLAQQDPTQPVRLTCDLMAEESDAVEGTIDLADQLLSSLNPEDGPEIAVLGRHSVD